MGVKKGAKAEAAEAADVAEAIAEDTVKAAQPTAEAVAEADPRDTPQPFYLYVLTCADGTFYTGYTNDVERRVRTHNAGKGAKYTRSRTPVKVAAQACFASKHEAMSAEFRFKRLSRSAKDELIQRAQTEDFAQILEELWGNLGEGATHT